MFPTIELVGVVYEYIQKKKIKEIKKQQQARRQHSSYHRYNHLQGTIATCHSSLITSCNQGMTFFSLLAGSQGTSLTTIWCAMASNGQPHQSCPPLVRVKVPVLFVTLFSRFVRRNVWSTETRWSSEGSPGNGITS